LNERNKSYSDIKISRIPSGLDAKGKDRTRQDRSIPLRASRSTPCLPLTICKKMKEGIHKAFTIIAKPIFLGSILLWSFMTVHFGYRLITGRELSEAVSKEVERNGIDMALNALFILVCVAFIRMSWQGLRYWPRKYPKFRVASGITDPVDTDNQLTRP
jgi:hypothetical protein